MKILQLCGKVPFPVRDGGCLAMEALSRDLNKMGDLVAVGAFATHKHPLVTEAVKNHPVYGSKLKAVHVNINLNPIKAIGSLLRRKIPYNLERFYTAEGLAFFKQLIELHQPDLIVLDGVQLLPYLEELKSSGAKIVYRSHNCEFSLWEDRAQHCKDPVKKIYLNLLASAMKNYERSKLSEADGILWISDADRKTMDLQEMHGRQIIYPFTIRLPEIRERITKEDAPPVFFHIGSMDWEPNVEGITWFLQKVWSRVHLKHAQLLFRIAGKNMPEKLMQLKLKGFENLGEVKDAQQFMADGDVMIVPLFSGSGIRVKIIEAMAMGKTVISTSKGVEGIEGSAGIHWIPAEGQESFLERINYVIDHREEIKKVGQAGRLLVEKLFSAEQYYPLIEDFIMHQQKK